MTEQGTRCSICGHANSRHNDCGNCVVSSPTRGQCPCNGANSSKVAVGSVPPRKRGRVALNV